VGRRYEKKGWVCSCELKYSSKYVKIIFSSLSIYFVENGDLRISFSCFCVNSF